MSRRLETYDKDASMPFFLWLRLLAQQRLIDLHRRHLGTKMRTGDLETAIGGDDYLAASSDSIAEAFASRLTSASQAAIRTELQQHVRNALTAMEPLDREILALRHYEMLSNEEAAIVLNLKKTAASNRYIRALRRLREHLGSDVWEQLQ